ncbi:cysteine rich repeat-containing protein [Beijerinckia indica]|uniref:Cysteine rich repeat protein n=1 Tax=Beijerinckia indica subsp. indica (strain ATCC 9039 / DSM 1715 / NCIMB 8712) TaxID=395963 RepID=B2ILC5_BEII9|nr:conserved hypothetical protein [Beijerinckia indica subsp. indica ATCC 9039]
MITLNHRPFITAAALLAVFAARPNAALAQMPAQAQALQQICRGDYTRLCSGVQPGGGRILTCLQSHLGELTSACQKALTKAPGANALPK